MKVITLARLPQVDSISSGNRCTAVEDVSMAGDAVIRCKEDIMALDAAAPPKVTTLSGVDVPASAVTLGRKPKRVKRAYKKKATDKPCVPEWVAMRSRGGKEVKRCHCRGGRFVKNSACSRNNGSK